MKRRIQLLLVFFAILSSEYNLQAQMNGNIWFDGLYRSYFTRDALNNSTTDDTLSPRNTSNGYNLLDLNTHINPIKDIEIFAQLRIRNSFGSFFGSASGTQINVRQLKARGVINNKLRFSVGDLFLKQSKFTLYNYDEELSGFENDMFKPYRDIIHYENFYIENRWRLQGIQTDFSYEFDRFIRNLSFDLFVTRPSGSSQISETTASSDLLLSGVSMVSEINKRLIVSLNYVNLFEVPSSGTSNISVRNPVYDLSILHHLSKDKYRIENKIQTGFSKRFWLHSELANGELDTISNHTKGMFFELDNKFIKRDSSLLLTFGYRYVDPNFRSAGAQTRRLDYASGNINTTYPIYTNMSLIRPPSVFDLVSDDQLYNQDLSSVLMVFNPIYSNILPFGDATPNRTGIYLKAKINNEKNVFLSKINSGFFKEVIGQGASEKRNFALIKGFFKINFHRWLNWKKELSVSTSSESEFTKRGGEAVSSLNLFSHQMNTSVNAELTKNLFIQASYKLFNANGNEFLTQRDDYGNITYFASTEIDQKDHILSLGMLYKFRKNAYASLNYNWWGTEFTDQPNLDYKYNRLILILSVEL
ncbi:MAG: hypothetical protein CBE48_003280 [Flavobacteriales bacterium TMED288]|nr:hypothetical protein [Flavobacteriales bacterium]RPG53113.1 MAG: hypothetical protein CBE48_003280 [Flavobacteriales bacterium TMED288]|tara:strand:- start:5036 stop:6799 length:1764 start_codon:yes stop_codon:yes gene_type:complete